MKELERSGRIKGIALNTSNYRSSQEISNLCKRFQAAVGNDALHCIVDTSRNYRPVQSKEWCNVRIAGMGHEPTSNTGFSNLDYYVWIKPPGESDGTCDGGQTADAMRGPGAGQFFKDHFQLLWNQGYFVDQLKMPKIDGSARDPNPAPAPVPEPVPEPAPEPVSSQPTPAPTSAPSPKQTSEVLPHNQLTIQMSCQQLSQPTAQMPQHLEPQMLASRHHLVAHLTHLHRLRRSRQALQLTNQSKLGRSMRNGHSPQLQLQLRHFRLCHKRLRSTTEMMV